MHCPGQFLLALTDNGQMAERIEKVYDRIRQELQKNPALGSRDLYEQAQQLDKSIGEDTLQQFHARYVLPVKREQSGKKGGRTRGAKKAGRKPKTVTAATAPKAASQRRNGKAGRGGTDRDQVRAVLMQFAQDFSAAETKSEIVGVMSRIDEYVDEIAGRTA